MSEHTYKIELNDGEYAQILQLVEAAWRSIEPEDEDDRQEKEDLNHLFKKLARARQT